MTTEVTSLVVRTLLDKLWILLKQQKDKIDKLIDKIDSLKKIGDKYKKILESFDEMDKF
jgi:hypothetical protein